MSDPEARCDDCSQLEKSRIHRDTSLKHFHLFSIPLMLRPAGDFPSGWPRGIELTMCGRGAKQLSEHDLEMIRRQAWKWVQEEETRTLVAGAPLAD